MPRETIPIGKILLPPHYYPEQHELETAGTLADIGYDIEFLRPSRTKGVHTPDIKMRGILWEIKSPTGNGKKTVEKQLQRAGRQSKNIVFDGRRSKLSDEYIEKELRRQYRLSQSIKRLVFIDKMNRCIDIKR